MSAGRLSLTRDAGLPRWVPLLALVRPAVLQSGRAFHAAFEAGYDCGQQASGQDHPAPVLRLLKGGQR